MQIAGYILIILGGIIFAYWWVHLLGLAYRCGGGWFLGCLFVPILWIVFVLLNPRITAKPFGYAFLGLVLTGIGGAMVSAGTPR